MSGIICALLLDYLYGCFDSIVGLAFIRDLAKDAEYEELAAPGPQRTTVLHLRRLQSGTVNRPTEKVFRLREKAWKRVSQCAVVNVGIILSVQCLSYAFSYIIGSFSDRSYGVYFSHLLALPPFIFSKIPLALWFSDIAGACHRQLKLPDPPPVDFRVSVADTIVSFLLATIFLIQGSLTEYLPIPIVSSVLMFLHMSLLNSMYSFEYFWSSRSVILKKRIDRIESRWSYFVGFGTPLTILTTYIENPLINACIFAAAFPFFIISSYKAKWNRPVNDARIPELRIFSPSMIITDKVSTVASDFLLPSM